MNQAQFFETFMMYFENYGVVMALVIAGAPLFGWLVLNAFGKGVAKVVTAIFDGLSTSVTEFFKEINKQLPKYLAQLVMSIITGTVNGIRAFFVKLGSVFKKGKKTDKKNDEDDNDSSTNAS